MSAAGGAQTDTPPHPPTVYCKLVKTRLQLCNSLTSIYSRQEVCLQVPSDCWTCSGPGGGAGPAAAGPDQNDHQGLQTCFY